MNTQAPTISGAGPFTFAGFQWPRYHAPRPETVGTGRGFYLDSDGQPFTRWQWCDEVDGVRIYHTGWFCDEYGDGGKIRGIVVALPRGRFLAGWSMGEGMASTVDADLYDTADAAAYAADSMAESAAENEREYQTQQTEEMED